MLQQAIADVIAGRPISVIAREWNEAGVLTARGNQWSPAQVGQLLKSPRLAGWRLHQGEIAVDRDGLPVRGQWEPVVDQDTFDRLQGARKGDHRGRKTSRGSRNYLLSGIARCGICNGSMSGQRISDTSHNYFCRMNPAARDHTNTASGTAVDRIVTALAIERSRSASLEPVEVEYEGAARLAEIDEELREVMVKLREGSKIPKAMLWAQAEALGEERETHERGRTDWLARTSGPSPVEMDAQTWADMELSEKQAHVESVLGVVIIQPPRVKRPGSRFDSERVQLV